MKVQNKIVLLLILIFFLTNCSLFIDLINDANDNSSDLNKNLNPIKIPASEVLESPTPDPSETPTPDPSETPTPDPTETPLPPPIVLESQWYPSYSPNWVFEFITSHNPKPSAAGLGAVDYDSAGNYVLMPMGDCLAPAGTYGVTHTGYTASQYTFDAPAAGTIRFDVQHHGWNLTNNTIKEAPKGILEFYLDLDVSDFFTPPMSPDWSNTSVMMDTWNNIVIPIPGPGTYRLTWRAEKILAEYDEDLVYLDNVEFHYE